VRSVEIVPFALEYVEAVSQLEARAGDAGWSRAQFEQELMLALSRFFVMTGGSDTSARERVIGYGGYWQVAGEAQITNLVIHPDHRRRHLGAELLAFLIKDARRRACHSCRLEVRAANRAARALYAREGFGETSRRLGFYQNPPDDAVLMEKKL
jgi:[ribosomal protein S18]-alanine N-acetyltransferase